MAQGPSVNKLVLSIVIAASAGSLATTAEAAPTPTTPGAAVTAQAHRVLAEMANPKLPAKKTQGVIGAERQALPPATKSNDRVGFSYLPRPNHPPRRPRT